MWGFVYKLIHAINFGFGLPRKLLDAASYSLIYYWLQYLSNSIIVSNNAIWEEGFVWFC
jgi:hypothetical protein